MSNLITSMTCPDHWHCDPTAAPHKCDAPDRAKPCPTCGAITVASLTDKHIAEMYEVALATGNRGLMAHVNDLRQSARVIATMWNATHGVES